MQRVDPCAGDAVRIALLDNRGLQATYRPAQAGAPPAVRGAGRFTVLRNREKYTKLLTMKRFRTILVVALCIALPHAATAALLQSYTCQHMRYGAMSGMAYAHDVDHHGGHRHANAAESAPATPAAAATDQCLDCKVKCVCGHHCTSGNAAAIAVALQRMQAPSGATATAIGRYAQTISELHRRSLLRPPIEAPQRAT